MIIDQNPILPNPRLSRRTTIAVHQELNVLPFAPVEVGSGRLIRVVGGSCSIEAEEPADELDQRAMGVHAGAEEILAAPDYLGADARRGAPGCSRKGPRWRRPFTRGLSDLEILSKVVDWT